MAIRARLCTITKCRERRMGLPSSTFHTVRVDLPLHTWPALVFARFCYRVRRAKPDRYNVQKWVERNAPLARCTLVSRATWCGVAFLLSALVRVPCSVGVVLGGFPIHLVEITTACAFGRLFSLEGWGCNACLAFAEDPPHSEGCTWLRFTSGVIRKEE